MTRKSLEQEPAEDQEPPPRPDSVQLIRRLAAVCADHFERKPDMESELFIEMIGIVFDALGVREIRDTEQLVKQASAPRPPKAEASEGETEKEPRAARHDPRDWGEGGDVLVIAIMPVALVTFAVIVVTAAVVMTFPFVTVAVFAASMPVVTPVVVRIRITSGQGHQSDSGQEASRNLQPGNSTWDMHGPLRSSSVQVFATLPYQPEPTLNVP